MDAIERIAEAALYEGYILWPYRRSAIKNQQRWTFGGVYPETFSQASEGSDPSLMQTQCLLESGGGARLDVEVRCLQVVERAVLEKVGDRLHRVDELRVGAERYLAWDEAVERRLTATGLEPSRLGEPHRIAIDIPASAEQEWLADGDGRPVGALVRSWREIRGEITLGAEPLGRGVVRITVRVTNTTPWAGGTRDEALKQTLVSTHTVLHATDGAFVSLMDPPDRLRELAEGCQNIGTWPVLVGEPGDRHTMLSSPITLYDHPQIAPESPGDLFDGTEIDQLLILNILSLTDEEKQEMRDSDPRARAILERSESLAPEDFMRLHGAIRDFGPPKER